MSVLLSAQNITYTQKEILGSVVWLLLTAVRIQFPYQSSRSVIKAQNSCSCIEKTVICLPPSPPLLRTVNLNTASAPSSKLLKRQNNRKHICFPLWIVRAEEMLALSCYCIL